MKLINLIGQQVIYLLYGFFATVFVCLPSEDIYRDVVADNTLDYGILIELAEKGFSERWWWTIPIVILGYVAIALLLNKYYSPNKEAKHLKG